MTRAAALLLLCACSGPPASSAQVSVAPTASVAGGLTPRTGRALPDPIEGMTVSCPTWGWEWGTDAMVDTMVELRDLGVEWITIHPYARIGNDGSVSFRPFPDGEPPEFIARPIREAHALGLKIMIKPHLAYWRSRWDWRGAIEFDAAADQERFYADYTAWIEAMAVASRGADLFVVGTELDKLTGHEAQWRAIIERVRAKYDGPLTFASNWDSYERVPFWDALDAVGIQAYFPLVEPGAAATDDAVRAGWSRTMRTVAAFSKATKRPVVFTELGYNASSKAAEEPWAYAKGGPDAEAVQTRSMRAALAAVAAEPSVRGAFLWKWFPGRTVGEDFLASTPAMRAVIAEAWGRAP